MNQKLRSFMKGIRNVIFCYKREKHHIDSIDNYLSDLKRPEYHINHKKVN